MGAGFAVFAILGVIGVVIAIRFAAGGLDRDRVAEYVRSRGGRVLDTRWAPFGPGWFGDRSDRIYLVRYVDAEGNEHEAHCKTSLMTGVYFTEDRIVHRAGEAQGGDSPAGAPEPDAASLAEENRRLREEIERLKREAT